MRFTLYLLVATLLLLTSFGCQNTDGIIDPTANNSINTEKLDGETTWARPAYGYRICGIVYDDGNESAHMEVYESGMPNVEVILSNGWHRVTDANGYYCFYPVPNGDYSVEVVAPNGYYSTSQTPIDVTVNNGSVSDILFGLNDNGQNPGPGDGDWSICGTVYWWTLCNGRAPAEGVELTLILDDNSIATVYSDENGDYCFTELDNGEYQVRAEDVYSFGGNPRYATVEDEDLSGIDFRVVPE